MASASLLTEWAAAKEPPFRHELEAGRGYTSELRPSASHIIGNGVMPRRAKYTAFPAELNEEVMAARHRQQDDDFCRALLAAIYAEKEACRVGVCTEPGTKKPILNYHPSD
jgi:hypothetical protein